MQLVLVFLWDKLDNKPDSIWQTDDAEEGIKLVVTIAIKLIGIITLIIIAIFFIIMLLIRVSRARI
jgi:heme/copper-type cytochrome/quinol oxidase subunit 2